MPPIPISPQKWCHLCLPLLAVGIAATAETLDLSGARSVSFQDSAVVRTAGRVLEEEVYKRTGISLAKGEVGLEENSPSICLFPVSHTPETLEEFVSRLEVPDREEAFAVAVDRSGKAPRVVLAGRDEAGVLFAVGWFLLHAKMLPGLFEFHSDTQIATSPRYPHRGHQIGFRNLSHCYDAWTAETYEQYMRELAIFGANAFETTSFSDPDSLNGPHAKLTNREMMEAWSRICSDYGFEFWLFGNASGGSGESEERLDRSIERNLETLRVIPHLDHLYLTGGDGHTDQMRPDLMLEWLGRLAPEARKIHPELGIWASNQGFPPEQNNWFFDYLQREQPDWLTGVVYGAWTRILPEEQRRKVPARYPIRRYNDIGHCVRGQYPVAGWDRAFAQTLGREPFAPRPVWQARIHNLFDEHADGFVTYSDGVGDDLNKFVWTALGWDPDRDLEDIVLDYSRFFFGWDIAERVREGLFRFEEHFEGPLADNKQVENTFTHWRALEDQASQDLLANWRFQECLLRAYYDHYTRLRLLKAQDIEARACEALDDASEKGIEEAIEKARKILAEPDCDQVGEELKSRILHLGAELHASIGAQLDVKNYQARNPERGAVLDFLETPLNNRRWIEYELEAILEGRKTATSSEKPQAGDERLARLARLVEWEDPGPKGFYDDLGCAWDQPRLVKPKPLWDDPAGVTTPREEHLLDKGEPYRLSWLDVEEALNDTPLVLRYEDLDRESSYRVRVTYLGRYNAIVRLLADDRFEIHGAYGHTVEGVRQASHRDSPAAIHTAQEGEEEQDAFVEVIPLEFVVPKEATADGRLELRWERLAGRGTQVAEVWLFPADQK